MKKKATYRHLLKALTWRIVGTLDTIILSTIISGNTVTGLKIGFLEVFTKTLLYYLHERAWFNLNLSKFNFFKNSNARHISKTITWRILGTLDTFLMAWLVTGNPLTGLKIGLVEVFTKMLLYYFHERVWYKINFGLNRKNNKTSV